MRERARVTGAARARDRRPLFAVGLVLVLALPQLGLARGLGHWAAEAVWLALGLLTLGWVLFVERLPLASIGLRRPTAGSFGWALAATVALMASVMLCYALILPALGLPMNRAAVGTITALPAWVQLLMFVRAGVVEEILYRGYPIERLEALTGSKWVAALVPGVLFIAAHWAFWGAGQLIVVAFGTAILTALYLWRRDLVCCMIAHVLTDMIGFGLANAQGG